MVLDARRKSIGDVVAHGPSFHAKTLAHLGKESTTDLVKRHAIVKEHYPQSYGVDDFMTRVEILLCKAGFTGDSSIAVLNLCRDEICNSLKKRVEAVYGSAFNILGLGAVLTCGVTGMGAGLSHSPQFTGNDGREKYIFFSFPHIAINASGEPGKISREARPDSHACGALLKALGDLKSGDFGNSAPCSHEHLDPEYSILRRRLHAHLSSKDIKYSNLDLVKITKCAEEAITQDLETLIRHSVNTEKADYAVVTGIQIHNWTDHLDDNEPDLEFIAPGQSYTVVKGKKVEMDLDEVSALTPRMIRLLYQHEAGDGPDAGDMPAGPVAVEEMRRSKRAKRDSSPE